MQGVLHKTLIIRLSSVGDIVLSSPLLRALHGRYPDCQIEFLVKEEYADLVRHNPHVTRVIPFSPGGDLIALRRALAAARYDLIIDIHDSLRSRFLTAGAAGVTRINKRKTARWLLVHFKRDVYPRFGGAPDVPGRYLETVRAYGVTDDGRAPEIFYPPEARAQAEALLREAGVAPGARCAGICPGARHANKMWPAGGFAEAAAALATRHGFTLLIFGSGEERPTCDAVEEEIRRALPGTPAVNLAGRLSLLETAAAFDRCALVIANDSGLMHIAAARGIPLVAVFGPTVRQFGFAPRGIRTALVEHPGLPCRPCTHIGLEHCPEGHFRCMKEIAATEVTGAAERVLAS